MSTSTPNSRLNSQKQFLELLLEVLDVLALITLGLLLLLDVDLMRHMYHHFVWI
jgi:hypothetical protein